jgi:hypothetical protein
LGGLVEGLFAKTFRSGVQPVEIAKRVVREMDDGKQVAVNEVWAPRFQQIETALVAELKTVILDNAGERRWGLVGPPEVEMFVDQKLKRGELSVEASLAQGEQPIERPAAPATKPTRAQLRVHEDGAERAIPLDKELVTIGRLSECDVVIDDNGASRRHAQIRTVGGVSTLTDLGSTNGTKVNGREVQSTELSDGDRITVGATRIDYRSG